MASPMHSPPEERAVVDAAAKETVEKITSDLSGLKLSLNQTIAKLAERLTEEAERLATIQKAIAIAQKELEETQKIKVTAGMLQRMIEVQKQREEEFGKEVEATRRHWEEEQKEHEERVRRERAREQDEYQYHRELTKKRDQDERGEERSAFERELAAEKEVRAVQLKELEDLRRKAAQFPAELERAVKEALVKSGAEVKREAEIAAKLTKQEADSQLNLAQQKIATLEETVRRQMAEIARLNEQLAKVAEQFKEVAVSVVEGDRRESSIRQNQDSK